MCATCSQQCEQAVEGQLCCAATMGGYIRLDRTWAFRALAALARLKLALLSHLPFSLVRPRNRAVMQQARDEYDWNIAIE